MRWSRGRRLTALAAVLLVAGVSTSVAVRHADPGHPLVWSDEFSGPAGTPADPASWQTVQGGDGWGNGELECYTPARGNSALDGHGDLVITALRQPGHVCSDGRRDDYTSARLITLGRRSFTYGSVQVRAEMPTGSGAWPAIWAQGIDYPTAGWPACGEIDISEVVGSHPTQTRATLHGPQAGDASRAYDATATHDLPTPLSDGFHVYGMTWSADRISFSIDGHTYSTETRAEVEKQGAWPFDHPYYLLLDLAVGGNLPGSPDATATWPQRMVVDYVHVFGT